jgi:hypothetical protein
MFSLRNQEDGTEKVCGVIDTANHDFFETFHSQMQARKIFVSHQGLLISKAVNLIKKGKANAKGHYILTRGKVCK